MGKILSVINFYLIKSFLKKFFYVCLSISLLILIINLFDVSNKVKGVENITIAQILLMSALQIPPFIADIIIFIINLAAMLTLFELSSKSEIIIMRSAGMSLWKILSPMAISAFMIGLIFIFIFLPFTIFCSKSYKTMELQIIKKEQKDSFAPKNGIWLKQENINNPGQDIKIRAKKVYRKDLVLEDVTLWFFDEKNQFYKKIDAKNMFLYKGNWLIQSAILNDENNINKKIKSLEIATNLDPDFIVKKIINNFEDVKLFPILDLPKLIQNLESSGFSSRKFKVYFHSLMNYPLLFTAISLIASYFAINSIRSRNNMIYIVIGTIFGLITYISLNIVNALGASGVIPSFMATWMITLLFLAIAVLLVFRKENL